MVLIIGGLKQQELKQNAQSQHWHGAMKGIVYLRLGIIFSYGNIRLKTKKQEFKELL